MESGRNSRVSCLARHPTRVAEHAGHLRSYSKIGALIIRIGFWGTLNPEQ